MGGLLTINCNGDFGVFHGRKADKRAMVRATGGVLCGTGFGAHGHGEGLGGFPATKILVGSTANVGNDLPHTGGVDLVGVVGDVHLAYDFRLGLLDQGTVVRGGDTVEEGGAVAGAPVCQGAGVHAQLQGGITVLGLADGGQNTVTCVPHGIGAGVGGRFTGGVGAPADFFGQLNTGWFAQAEALGGFIHHLPGEAVAQNIEEIVAGDLQGIGGINGAVGGIHGGVQQALGVKAFAQLGEHTLILNGFHVAKNPFALLVNVFHGGNQGTHLEGGAGGVGSAEGAVEEGLEGVGHDIVPILVHGGQVIGGVAGTGQNLTGFHLHHHHGSTLGIQCIRGGVLLRVNQPLHDLGERILGNFLQGDVNGGFHVVAGNRLFALQIALTDNGAFLGNDVQTAAVNAVEVLFKGLLKACLANLRVHGVALFFILGPVGIVHFAHVAQNMGGVLGVIFPDGGGFHHQAGRVQFQNGGQILVGNVLDEGIVGQVGQTTQVKLIPQANHTAGFLVRPVLGNFIAGAHFFHQQGGGHVGVQTPAGHVALVIPLPGGVVAVQRINEGTGFGHGEMVVVLHTQLLTFFQQVVEVLITVVR